MIRLQCRRCRKRKIKCSGDTGDGHGCSNCRSAGNTDCQFLRVSISPDEAVMQTDLLQKVQSESLGTFSQFPYPPPGAAIAPTHLGGMYTPQTSRKPNMLSMGSSPARMTGFPRTHEFDLGADSHVFPRPVGVDSIPYGNEQSVDYSQSPAYMLPSAPSGSTLEYGASPWSPKIWDSMFNVNRQTNGVIYPDLETNNSLTQSPYSYMLPSQGISPNEISQSATAMTAVSSADGPGTDRTLPTPTCRSQQLSSNAASLNVLSPESNLAQMSELKGNFWNQRCETSPDQRTPVHTVPSNVPKCSNASTTPDLLFPYVPMPTTTDETTRPLSSTATGPSSANSAATSFTGLETLDHEYKGIPNENFRRSFSREHSAGQRLAMINDCTPEIYGYSSEKKSRDSDNRLMNGFSYQRVRHPDPPGAFSFNLLPDTLPEYHRSVVENVHRPPVSPLGNQGAY